MFSEWLVHGKPSVLGIASGAIAGLVAITPASGFVDPKGALVMGAAGGVGCYIAATGLKRMLGYDDSLDVFGVHGIGGIIGALLTGVFAVQAIGGTARPARGQLRPGSDPGVRHAATIVWCAVATFVILLVIRITIGMRVAEQAEVEGLDIALHGETVPDRHRRRGQRARSPSSSFNWDRLPERAGVPNRLSERLASSIAGRRCRTKRCRAAGHIFDCSPSVGVHPAATRSLDRDARARPHPREQQQQIAARERDASLRRL